MSSSRSPLSYRRTPFRTSSVTRELPRPCVGIERTSYLDYSQRSGRGSDPIPRLVNGQGVAVTRDAREGGGGG